MRDTNHKYVWKEIPSDAPIPWPDPERDERIFNELIAERDFIDRLLALALQAPENFSEQELQAMRNQIQLKDQFIETTSFFIEFARG